MKGARVASDVGSFLGGFGLEFIRTMLWVGTLGAGLTMFQSGFAQTASDLGVQTILGLGMFAISVAALTLPARDLAEGWLGMVSGSQPDEFLSAAENVGRGVCGLVFAAGWALLLVKAPPKTAEGAFLASFATLAMLVFAVGLAVPRIWFAVRAVPLADDDEAPLLKEVGKRARIFFACAFAGVALSFLAMNAAAFLNPLSIPAALRHYKDLDAGSSHHTLCRKATAGCPRERRLELYQPTDGPVHITLFGVRGAAVACRVRPVGAWATPKLRKQIDELLNGFRGMRELTVAVHRGQAMLQFVVPPGHDRCRYKAKMRAPSTARWWETAQISEQKLCRQPTEGCPAGIQLGLIAPHGPFDIDDSARGDICLVQPVGDWAPDVWNRIDAKLNRGEPGLRFLHFSAHDPMFRFVIPEGGDHCKLDVMLQPARQAAPARTPSPSSAKGGGR